MSRKIAERFEDHDASFADLWQILRRRKRVLASVCGVVFALTTLFTFMSTPKYQATVSIEFNKQNADLLGLDEERETQSVPGGSDDYSLTQQTQAKVLESETLALQVIKELNLERAPGFAKRPSLMDYLHPQPDESELPLEQARYRRMRILQAFRKSLRVEPLTGTRMINIRVLSPDAELSAAIANRLVADYKEQYFETRYQATVESSGWLAKQLADLKNDVATSQQKLVDYQKQVGILGTDETHNIVMTRLEELNRELMIAESNRILAQTIVQLVRNGNPELISGLTSPAVLANSSVSVSTLSSLETLRAQKHILDLEYAESSATFGAAHPKLAELQNKRNEVDAALHDEDRRLATRAENDLLAARNTEASLRASFDNEKEAANKLNDSAIQYTVLKHEVESKRDLYDGLLKKLGGAGVLAGLRSTNIVIVDPARPSDRPARPIVVLNLAVGLLGGLLLGIGSAFLAENIDDSVVTADDAESISMLPSMGMIPQWKHHHSRRRGAKPASLSPTKSTGLMVVSESRSHAAEAFRAVRTSIVQSIRRGVTTVLVVTSPLPGEGKTTVSLNCAATLAQQGSRVLLVEADLRRPKFCARLNLATTNGLTTLLGGSPCAELPVKLPALPNLAVIPAGPQPTYPTELLGSDRMRELIAEWRKEYDYVIFDTPPVLAVTDAVALAAICDLVLLVVRSRITKKQALARARVLFLRGRARVLGVVVNGFDTHSADYANYYGYKDNSELAESYYSPAPR